MEETVKGGLYATLANILIPVMVIGFVLQIIQTAITFWIESEFSKEIERVKEGNKDKRTLTKKDYKK